MYSDKRRRLWRILAPLCVLLVLVGALAAAAAQTSRRALRDEGAAEAVVDEIAKANKHRLVFLCREPKGRESLAVRAQGVKFGPWTQPDHLTLAIKGETLDAVWDAIVSQVAFGDTGKTGMSVEARIALAERIAALEKLVRELDTKCRKAKQIGKKNELFAQMRKAEAELEQARKELV